MIAQAKYRDIPWEEARKCQPVRAGGDRIQMDWETDMRGRFIEIVTPPVIGERNPLIACNGPFYKTFREVNGRIYVSYVCPHIAEIGD